MQAKVWNQAPIVRLILPFLAGILSAIYLPYNFPNALCCLSALIVVVAAIVLVPKFHISYKKSFWFGFIINSAFFLLAYQLTIYKTEKFSPNHFSKIQDSSHLVYARLSDAYIEKDRSLKVVLEITAVKNGNEWISTCGKAMVYFKKDAKSLNLKYGDELLLKANFKDIPEAQNPGEFNYKRFLSFHNVFNQTYIKNGEWLATGINSGNPILKYSIGLRSNLLTVLSDNHLTGDELSVGAALLLGYVDKLDADIITAYASTGALHVLSVSGLHVAIVYIVFSWFLFFLDKIKYGHIIKSFLLILFLWFYAALTGLSPSVLRAATMFTFIIIAKAFNRHTNIYNTLAASAFFLLLINPYLIMEVGFQLSYLAVIGIVYIQPKIKDWFQPENWFLNQIWTITAVSIAAQIATFPLGLHYFHQFPNYFLLSNLVVIPISTVIIYLGIAVFSFAKIPLFVKYLSICFTWAIWLLNSSVKWIEKLPSSLITGIHITVLETWLLYGLIILFFCYFTLRKYNYIVYALIATILILCIQIVEQRNEFNQKQLIVYNVPKTSAIDFIGAKANVLLTDSVFAKNESGLLFHVKHNWWELGLNESKIISTNIHLENLSIDDNYIQFYEKRIVILNKEFNTDNTITNPLKLDYLIISNNTKMSIANIQKMFDAKTIIFDSSNSDYLVNKWKEDCIKLHQSYYSVNDSGAFVEVM
jgi:competence protein ComEC